MYISDVPRSVLRGSTDNKLDIVHSACVINVIFFRVIRVTFYFRDNSLKNDDLLCFQGSNIFIIDKKNESSFSSGQVSSLYCIELNMSSICPLYLGFFLILD